MRVVVTNGKQHAEYDDLTGDPIWQAMDGWRTAVNESGFRKRLGETVSQYAQDGRISKSGKMGREYWTSGREIFARSFERWIQRKLESQGRKNTYLTGMAGTSPLWPTDAEVDAMAPHFEKIIDAYKQKNNITEKYSRRQIREYFQNEVDRQNRQDWLVDAMNKAIYARLSPKARYACQWVTLGTKDKKGEKGKGGAKVCIGEGGKIEKGPKGLKSRKISAITGPQNQVDDATRTGAKRFGVKKADLQEAIGEVLAERRMAPTRSPGITN